MPVSSLFPAVLQPAPPRPSSLARRAGEIAIKSRESANNERAPANGTTFSDCRAAQTKANSSHGKSRSHARSLRSLAGPRARVHLRKFLARALLLKARISRQPERARDNYYARADGRVERERGSSQRARDKKRRRARARAA